MANEKKIRKDVKFVYYQGYLKIDPEILNESKRKCNMLIRIKEKIGLGKELSDNQRNILADEEVIMQQNELYRKYGRNVWNASTMFQYVDEEAIDTNIDIGEMIIEIEPGTLIIDDDYISLQLTKMRDNMLPAKKKKGNLKEDIPLDNDEYIGEFTSVLYDKNNSVFMIQSNMHGVSVGQVERYLTLLRRHVIEEMKLEDLYEAACELSVVINSCEIDNIRGSQEVKKLRFRAADGVYTPFTRDEDNYLGKVRKSFGEKTGYVIDITISINKDEELKTIDKELVEDVLDNFQQINRASQLDSNVLVEITRKENANSATEVLNLLRPKMCDEITIKLKPRTSVVHKDLLKEMLKTYKRRKTKINQILGV